LLILYLKNLICIKGPVEKTLQIKKNLPKKISILRLDTDWYQSTKIELIKLFPLVEKKGIIIIDDYGYWKGARKAVDEYFKNKNLTMFKIDFTGRLIIKI
jgi:O-methyltransferase